MDFLTKIQNEALPILNTLRREAAIVYSRTNQRLALYSPLSLLISTVAITYMCCRLYNFLFNQYEYPVARLKAMVFGFIKKLPFVQGRIQRDLNKAVNTINEGLLNDTKGIVAMESLPLKGKSSEEVVKLADKYLLLENVDWAGGRTSGAVYAGLAEQTELLTKIYGKFAWTNPLHLDVFPDIRVMEGEVLSWVCEMFHGTPSCCGVITSGGTESIMMACLAYRNMALECGIQWPDMVVPKTAHAAFDKAAMYFRIRIIHVPTDPDTEMVNVAAMRRMITSNTCMLVASAPQFPHGIIDPVEAVTALGQEFNIPVHVDSCLGGFILPFMEDAGYSLPPFDFRVPGVMSISCDTHKYGCAPKGTSTLLWRHSAMREKHFFAQITWPGGIYATGTVAGSRSGALIAGTWAAMLTKGREGYVNQARDIVRTARWVADEVNSTPGLHIVGEPKASVIAIGSKDFNIYRLCEALQKEGWHVCACQSPPCFHFAFTQLQTFGDVKEQFIADVRRMTSVILTTPCGKDEGLAQMYGTVQKIPDHSIVEDMVKQVVGSWLMTTAKLEREMKAAETKE